jgi:topoisomerase IV subunit A
MDDNQEGLEQPDGTMQEQNPDTEVHKTISLSGMYENWFLDYASYVILERAVPNILDGLKPVQRRILHSMKELDDGRYNKVANIIGNTMKYHPHGDASIGDALVQLGQKDLLIDCQGNWGNIYTGDRAAASRYIEARLSKFALEVVFNPKTTSWKPSYDGRNKEPITLPVKFPLLLAQGGEGIAVGLASKILPHNFLELIDASIAILRNEDFEILPDFPTAGMADFTRYNDGLRGGKVRIRAKISQLDKKTLVITEIPFGTTTSSLIDSILAANDKGKIKIRKIDDNTAASVEILVHLAPGVSPDQTIDALYAFTDCEASISPNCCVIDSDRPRFIGVSEILRLNTQHTLDLLTLELEIEKAELEEQWHYSSLEKIFIEKRIYRDIEECTTWEAVIEAIDKGLDPYKSMFMREITRDDIIRLTEIKIKRISKYDVFKADEVIKSIEDDIAQVKFDLEHLIDYAIAYFERIKTKYGKGRERKTEIRNFENIEAVMVAVANTKLYVNRADGFAGSSLKKDEYVCDCSDIDDIIAFRGDGTFVVFKMAEKAFVGENVIHIDVFRKNDDRTIYNMVYQDGPRGMAYIKRFAVKGVTRDKEYDLTKGTKGSKVLYFTANANGEAEVINITLKPKPKLKKLSFEFDFSEIAIKGRNSQGNILTRHLVKRISKNGDGISTLGARKIWYDDSVQRLNTENRGTLLGEFRGDDKILTIYKPGYARLVNQDLSVHFDEEMILIEKYNPDKPFTAIYWDAEVERYYVKRFQLEDNDKKQDFIEEYPGTKLIYFSADWLPQIEITYDNSQTRKPRENEIVNLSEFIGIKGFKAKGKRITELALTKLTMLEPLPYEEPVMDSEGEGEEEEDDLPEIQLDSELYPDGRPDDADDAEQLTLF